MVLIYRAALEMAEADMARVIAEAQAIPADDAGRHMLHTKIGKLARLIASLNCVMEPAGEL